MALSSSKTTCAQLNANLTDVYAASATEVFYTGSFNLGGAKILQSIPTNGGVIQVIDGLLK